MKFWYCTVYLFFLGLIGFVTGRVLPKTWFHWEGFFYRARRFERGGRVYMRLQIRKWHRHLPDMSRLLPRLMPPKAMPACLEQLRPEHVVTMLRESCVAEFIHFGLCLGGFYCMTIWTGAGGLIISLLNVLGNIPFILAQRYNRPRLCKLLV